MSSLRGSFLLYLKGLAMGAADAVPGVSGGTIAFITGIYEELIESLRSIDGEAIRLLRNFQWVALWQHVHGTFLLTLFLGIGTSIVIFSRLILYLLGAYPILLWSFFFGLIIASAWLIARQIPRWSLPLLVSCGLGIALGLGVSILGRTETPENLPFIFLSGAIAICAMILPGISGSFILVLLGKYQFIFSAIKDFSLSIVGTFLAGCVIGLLSFSHLINWLLKKYHNLTIAFLTGVMLGSLWKVWPWKITLETYIDRHGVEKPLVQQNVLPWDFAAQTQQDSYVLGAMGLAILGFLLVYLLEKLVPSQK